LKIETVFQLDARKTGNALGRAARFVYRIAALLATKFESSWIGAPRQLWIFCGMTFLSWHLRGSHEKEVL
jgi:hypothetical protein